MEELLKTLADFDSELFIYPFISATGVVYHWRVYDEEGILVCDAHLRDLTKTEDHARRMLVEFHRKSEKIGWLPRSMRSGRRS